MWKFYYSAFFFIAAPILLTAQNAVNPEEIDTTRASNYILLDIADELPEDDYDKLLDSLKRYHTTDYFKLRMAYTKTGDYDPYSTDESDMFKKANKHIDSEDYKEALSVLEDILDDNYVNIQAHLMSAFSYYKLQDTVKESYHKSIYDGLLESITISGDGKSSKTAYIVIDPDEEYYFLGAFRLRRGIQSLAHSDGHSFDIMEVMEEASDEKFNIYFNIDHPMKQMESMFK